MKTPKHRHFPGQFRDHPPLTLPPLRPSLHVFIISVFINSSKKLTGAARTRATEAETAKKAIILNK